MRRSSTGTVYLVGAGPGDPGLLTLRAAELIRTADVLAHDALIPPAILALAAPDAELIPVGRRHGAGTADYGIHPAVLERAQAGRDVVRLKAGDPFVFGRGGEEAEELAQRGIPFQVVPGISAALGAAAYAGIPLTHRRYASGVILATGHDADGSHLSLSRWQALGGGSGTVVLFMAAAKVRANVARLIAAGRPPETPAACVVAATWPEQQVIVGTLQDLPERIAGIAPGLPALILVGDVVRLRQTIAWWERCPLRGKRLLVARARPGRSGIAAALRARGAEVVESPAVYLGLKPAGSALDRTLNRTLNRAMDDALDRLPDTDGVVFACGDSVAAVLTRLKARGLPLDTLRRAPLIAVGSQAERRLHEAGLVPQLALPGACGEAVGAHLESWRNRSFVLFTSSRGRPGLIGELEGLGASVTPITAYPVWETDAFWQPDRLDLAIFPSSSAVRAVVPNHPAVREIPALAIGQRTETELRNHGVRQVSRTLEDTPASVIAWVEQNLAVAAAAAGPDEGPAAVPAGSPAEPRRSRDARSMV